MSAKLRKKINDRLESGKGYPKTIWINFGRTVEEGSLKAFSDFAQDHPNITECHHILGEYDFMIRLRLKDMPQLEAFIESCLEYGQSTTYMIFSQLKP